MLKSEKPPYHALTTPEQARKILEDGDRGWPRALVYLAVDSFLRNPDEHEATIDRIKQEIDKNFRPSPGMPDVQHAKDRVVLAGTMGVNYLLLANQAILHFNNTGGEVLIGPPECYVSEAVAACEDPREDTFMRSIQGLFNAGQYIAEQSRVNGSPYAPYKPLWGVEMGIRQGMQPVDHRRNTQFPHNGHPLDTEIVRQAGGQFMRNVMHHMLLVEQAMPGASAQELQQAVVLLVDAAEVAAKYPREIQRARMGIPGAEYEKTRSAQKIIPHILMEQPGRPRVAGLERIPPHASMCPGQDFHEIPPSLHQGITPESASIIGLMTLRGALESPVTLFDENSAPRSSLLQ